jgi:hypothetical protein
LREKSRWKNRECHYECVDRGHAMGRQRPYASILGKSILEESSGRRLS